MTTLKLTQVQAMKINEEIKFRGIEIDRICKAHVTALSVFFSKKDLSFGNTIGMMSVDRLVNELQKHGYN